MLVKSIVAALLSAAVVAGPVVAAEHGAKHKPLGKMTCEDFLVLDDDYQPRAVYWAIAYAKGGEPEAAVLDVEGAEQISAYLVEECKKAPKESFWEKLKAELKKIEKKL